jgi:formamidopyrimidine-DNA glycosylase
MPELPEVETMVDRLQPWVGYGIVVVKVDPGMSARAAAKYLPPDEAAAVVGQTIRGVFRRGKFIVFMLERGALLCHNAMSGYWDSSDSPWTFDYVEGKRDPGEGDVRVQLMVGRLFPDAEGNNWAGRPYGLRFHDARMFGSLRYVSPEDLAAKLSALGPDAYRTAHLYEPNAVMDEDRFVAAFGKSRHAIKAALMEQDRMAGVGNIYASEACWVAGIDPRRACRDLTKEDLQALFAAVHVALRGALLRKLDYGGLKIYRRKECPQCKTAVVAEDLKGRKTFWCPTCQK